MKMPTTEAFLHAILPRSGLKCAVVIKDGRPRQFFFETTQALAAAITRFDAELHGTNGAVYHGCASYTGQGRRKADVHLVSALWLDLDAGPGKPYPDMGTALAALQQFISKTGAPAPLLVASGVGLHVYWPLARPLTRAEWEPYALGLKALCEARGLHAGPERTADCSSILRPPGTTHRKGAPRPVLCGPIPGPYPVEMFSGLRSLAGAACSSNPGPAPRTDNPRSDPGSARGALLARLQSTFTEEPINFEALTAGCAQLRRFKESHGRLPEPLWYAGLGVLAFCSGGEAVAQAWSGGHDNYSAAETRRRLERVREFSGPTTCAKFQSLDAAGCAGCRGGATPLDPARDLQRTRPPAPDVRGDVGQAPEPRSDQPIPGCPDYCYRDGALYAVSETTGKSGETVDKSVKITSFQVEVASLHTGEIKKEQAFYLLRHYRPHDGWREVTLPASKMFGNTMMPAMADLGIVVHDAGLFQKYIRDAVDHLTRKERSKMQYEQFGWKEDGRFLYGDVLFGSDSLETTAISQELRFRAQWLRPTQAGNLAAWKYAVDRLFGQGSEGMSFAILASFGAPLMRFLEGNEGGSVMSLVTRHSGAGKSTSLAGAYTVWSSSAKAIAFTQGDTKVSKFRSLGAMCNLPLVWDEFQALDPVVVADTISTFTSGRDKMRADSTGEIIHNAAGWQTIMFTGSNKSLVEMIMSSGESEALTYRILEFPVESMGDLKPSEAARLTKQLEENAGHAGATFLAYLVQPAVLAWAKKRMEEMADEIFAMGGFRKEHRFWVRTLAAAGTAAIMVEKLGLISFSPDRIMRWAIQHFMGQIDGQLARESLVPLLSRFLNAHVGETLVMPGPAQGRHPMPPIGDKPRVRVTVRVEVHGDAIYIADNTLRAFMAKNGGGYKDLLKELEAKEILLAARTPIVLSAGTEMRSGQVWCVKIDGGHPALTGVVRDAVGPKAAAEIMRVATEKLVAEEPAPQKIVKMKLPPMKPRAR